MADLSKLVNELSELTVLEAAELAKILGEKWGVNATGVATFEDWLRDIQGFDPSALTPDELPQWRKIFDEINRSPTPKVGLMKLRSLPGEHRYAVAIREGSNFWLTLWVRRSPKGEFFVMMPRADRGWDPHNSYHLDGTFHAKSHARVLVEKKLQPLTSLFRGTEHLGGYGGTAKALAQFAIRRPSPGLSRSGLMCRGPRNGTVVVDLVEPGCEPISWPFSHLVSQEVFRDTLPWVVIRVGSRCAGLAG